MDGNMEVERGSNLTPGQGQEILQIPKLPQRRRLRCIPRITSPNKVMRSQSLRTLPFKFSITALVERGITRAAAAAAGAAGTAVLPSACLEKEIIKNIQTFPTILQQQTKGPNFTPNWNWHRIFKKHQTDAEERTSMVEKEEIFRNFHSQVKSVSSLLDQIRNDFENGLQEYDPRPDGYVNQLCRGMQVCQVGTRGRSTVSDNMVPFMRDIFQNELNKQAAYSKWTTRILTDKKDVRQRNDLVKWVIKIAKHLGYAAETAHLAVFYVDAYLGIRGNKITPSAWMLLGISVLHIAAKLEEPLATKVQCLIEEAREHSGYKYKKEEVYWMEKEILTRLQFDVYPPLPSVLVQLVILGGSLTFPTVNMRKLAMDLSRGMLYRSLLNHELVTVSPIDKAKFALETAVEFIYYQYNICMKRDMSSYDPASGIHNCDPGQSLGELMLNLCTETFTQRFTISRKLPPIIPAMASPASPVRNVKV